MTVAKLEGGTPCKEVNTRLLLVEGKDDCNGIYQLAVKHGIANSFGIWEGGSVQGALERFGGLLLASKERPVCLGLILDSDRDSESAVSGRLRRWAQVTHRLNGFGYTVPDEPDPNGTVIPAPLGYPRIGVWLMPDNVNDGMFEDFLMKGISAKARSFSRRVSLIAKAYQVGNFNDLHLAKAMAHSFLAWQDEPGKPFGIAIKAEMIDVSNGSVTPFADWLRRLYF